MGISAGAMAAITGGSQVLGNLIQNSGTKRSQKRADKMNIKFFNMQNEYNTPESQMARLKKAGLNPHLIYGSSVGGATGNAGSGPSPSKAAPYTMQGIPQAAMQGYQAEAQVQNTNADTLQKLFDLGVDKKYKPFMVSEELRQVTLTNAKKLMENEALAPFVKTAVERANQQLLSATANATKSQAQASIETWKADLTKQGISPTGNFMMTMLRLLVTNIPSLQDALTPPDNKLD